MESYISLLLVCIPPFRSTKLEDAMQQWLAAEGPVFLAVTTDSDAVSLSFFKKLMDMAKPGNPLSNFPPSGS